MRLLLSFMTVWPLLLVAQDAATLTRQAQQAITAGDYPRADSMLRQALEINPNFSEAWRNRARLQVLRKDQQAAITDFDRAIELDPQSHRALVGRGGVWLQLRNPTKALADFDRAIAVKPDYALAHAYRGDAFFDQKQWQTAHDAYDEALRLDPKSATVWLNRGSCRVALGNPRAALEDFDKAEALDPKIPHTFYNRGLAKLALQDYSGAESDLTRSIEKGHRVDVAQAKLAEARKGLSALGKAPAGIAPATHPVAVDRPARPLPGLSIKLPVLDRPTGELWTPASRSLVPIAEESTSILISVSEPTRATRALPLASIGYAMEGLRGLAGPLDASGERAWAARWQPFFDFPEPASVQYFQKLNPMLDELVATRTVSGEAARDFDAAWAEAVISQAAGDTEARDTALAQAERHSQVLSGANSRLASLQKRVQALGNPPDPKAAKAQARAWSRKWTGGCSDLARFAFLWRVSQVQASNIDAAMSASAASAQGQSASHNSIWPAAEETWCQWLDAGKPGPEPKGPKPSDELFRKANQWVNGVYATAGVHDSLVIYFFHNYPAELAAREIAQGRKVVPRPIAGYVPPKGVNVPPGPPAPPVTAAATSPEDKARQAEEARAKAEAIAEKQDLIALIQSNLSKDEAEWKAERDPNRKEALYLRILNNRSAIVQERDLMESLKTGTAVHTRTPSDEYCHDLMIVRTVENMRAVDETRTLTAAIEKMASSAEPDQVKQLREFIGRQMTAKDVAEGNQVKARQVAQAVFDTVQGRRQQRAAQSLEDSLIAEDYLVRAQRVKSVAGLALLVTGIAAPAYATGAGAVASAGQAVVAINVIYGGATGTIEGGPVEGVKQAVAQSSVAGMVVTEMMTGYQRGGLASSGGVTGALERGAEAFLAAKLVESIASKAGQWWSARSAGATPPPPSAKPGLTVGEFIEGQTFQLARNTSLQRIRQYRQTTEQLKAARAGGASAAEIAELEAKRFREATQVNEDFLAKRIIKAEGKQARAGKGSPYGNELEQDFATTIETINRTKVDPAFQKSVREARYHWRRRAPDGTYQPAGELKFKEMRHAGAEKTANTDRDLAAEEMANQPGAVYQLYKGDTPVKLADAEQDLQQLYNAAYHAATGGNPQAAMQNVTTSRHREAYKDLAYTQLTDPASVSRINKGWAEQTTEVLSAKVTHAGPGQGDFAALFKKIDGANQAAKDIEKRLLPILAANQSKALGPKAAEIGQDIERWKAIQRTLETLEKDPVGASRELRVLTGLDSIGEVADLVTKRFLGSVKLQ